MRCRSADREQPAGGSHTRLSGVCELLLGYPSRHDCKKARPEEVRRPDPGTRCCVDRDTGEAVLRLRDTEGRLLAIKLRTRQFATLAGAVLGVARARAKEKPSNSSLNRRQTAPPRPGA